MRCAALPNNGCNTASAQATPAAYAWLHACCDRERAQALPRPLCRTCMRSRCCNVWTAMQEAVVLTNMAERKMNEERCRSRCSCYDCFQCRVWARHAIVRGSPLPPSRRLLRVARMRTDANCSARLQALAAPEGAAQYALLTVPCPSRPCASHATHSLYFLSWQPCHRCPGHQQQGL